MKKVQLSIQYSWKKTGFEKFFDKNKDNFIKKIQIYSPIFLVNYQIENLVFADKIEIYLKYVECVHNKIYFKITPSIQNDTLIFICNSEIILKFLDLEKQEYLRVLQIEARQSR
jgi:hypothetical protein